MSNSEPFNKIYNFTNNQQNVLNSLTDEFTKFEQVCEKYANIQKVRGLSGWAYIWKSDVNRILNSLFKYDVIEYRPRGFYKLKSK